MWVKGKEKIGIMDNPITIVDISFISWLRLLFGLILFLGPGKLLLSISPFRKEFDRSIAFIVTFGYSVAIWAILLSISYLFKINIPTHIAIFFYLLCWLIYIIIDKPHKSYSLNLNKVSFYRISLWIFIFLTFMIRIWIVRFEVAGLGSDSYHHTLFAQMIRDNGMIPMNMGSNYPVITFTYHFGFHAIVAFLGWISGLPTRLLVLILGYILLAICSLAVGFSTERITGSKIAGFAATICVACFFIFPSYMLMWGRYTQLTGLTLISIFLIPFWSWINNDYSKSGIIELGILAAGTGLTHYRMVAFLVIGVLVIVVFQLLGKETSNWKKGIKGGILLFFTSLSFLVPWFIHLWQSFQVGYPVEASLPASAFFSIDRLGQEALNYPLNLAALILVGISILLGILHKDKIIIAITLWCLIALLPSRNIQLLDTVSVLISLGIPLAILVGVAISKFCDFITSSKFSPFIKNIIAPVLVGALGISGIIGTLTYPTTLDSYLKASDLKAFEFINEDIPMDAKFMINIYRFNFSDILMVGSDGGYWIPLLTGRETVVPPMVFTNERVSDPIFVENLRMLGKLNGDLTSPESLDMLSYQGITHVYIGERGGPINPVDLLSSPYFKLVYESNSVYIFEYNQKGAFPRSLLRKIE